MNKQMNKARASWAVQQPVTFFARSLISSLELVLGAGFSHLFHLPRHQAGNAIRTATWRASMERGPGLRTDNLEGRLPADR